MKTVAGMFMEAFRSSAVNPMTLLRLEEDTFLQGVAAPYQGAAKHHKMVVFEHPGCSASRLLL